MYIISPLVQPCLEFGIKSYLTWDFLKQPAGLKYSTQKSSPRNPRNPIEKDPRQRWRFFCVFTLLRTKN